MMRMLNYVLGIKVCMLLHENRGFKKAKMRKKRKMADDISPSLTAAALLHGLLGKQVYLQLLHQDQASLM